MSTRTIIPATSGYYLAIFFPAEADGNGEFLDYKPIVAWEIECETSRESDRRFYDTNPIAVGPCNVNGEGLQAIKLPSGRYSVDGVLHDNEACALVELRRLHKMDVEYKARRKAVAP